MARADLFLFNPHHASLRKAKAPQRETIFFDRAELSLLLGLYGRMVARGLWRDYAIGHDHQRAVFSVFRRASEVPLYRIVKEPALAGRQGLYRLVAASGMILHRGGELAPVLKRAEGKSWVRDALFAAKG